MPEPATTLVAPDLLAVFAAGRARIAAVLGTAARIDHVGPSAVPGLAAPALVDVLVQVPDADGVGPATRALVAAGFRALPAVGGAGPLAGEEDGVELHVHVAHAGEPAAVERLAFRDALLADPALRSAYAALRGAGADVTERGLFVRAATARALGRAVAPPALSPLALRLGGSPDAAWHVHHLANARVRAGEDVIVLSIGEPDTPTPDVVVDAMAAAVRCGRTKYTEARGEPEIVEALAERSTRQAGRPVDEDRITFLPGAQSALFAVLMSVLGTGDEAIVPEPVYAPYLTVLRASGAGVVHVPLPPEHGFHPRIDDIAAAIGPRTRALVLTSPHNPTGAVLAPDELAAIGTLCRDLGIWLVVDEVYAEFAYARPFSSALALDGAEEYVAVVSSLSKSHAMTGFRHGWAVTPPELGRRVGVLAEAMLFGCPPFVQDAGVAALRDAPDVPVQQRAAYIRRIDALLAAIGDAPGVVPRRPEGGMFIMLDVRETGLAAEDFALRLLAEEAVSVLPTDAFGPSGVGHVRISLGADDGRLVEAGTRFGRFARRLADEQQT